MYFLNFGFFLTCSVLAISILDMSVVLADFFISFFRLSLNNPERILERHAKSGSVKLLGIDVY